MRTRKFLSLALALALVLSLTSIPTFAADYSATDSTLDSITLDSDDLKVGTTITAAPSYDGSDSDDSAVTYAWYAIGLEDEKELSDLKTYLGTGTNAVDLDDFATDAGGTVASVASRSADAESDGLEYKLAEGDKDLYIVVVATGNVSNAVVFDAVGPVAEADPVPPKTYKVTFKANDGGSTQQDVEVNDVTSPYELPENTFTAPSNKEFTGWSTAATSDEQNPLLAAGDSVTLDADATFYAIWGDKTSEETPVLSIFNVKADGNDVTPNGTTYTVAPGVEIKATYKLADYTVADGIWFKTSYKLGSADTVEIKSDKLNGSEVTALMGSGLEALFSTDGLEAGEYTIISAVYSDSDHDHQIGAAVTIILKIETAGSDTYTITFNANTGSGSQVAQTGSGDVDLPEETTFTPPAGKEFKGWAESAGGAVIEGKYSLIKDITLYAIWGEIAATNDGFLTGLKAGSATLTATQFAAAATAPATFPLAKIGPQASGGFAATAATGHSIKVVTVANSKGSKDYTKAADIAKIKFAIGDKVTVTTQTDATTTPEAAAKDDSIKYYFQIAAVECAVVDIKLDIAAEKLVEFAPVTAGNKIYYRVTTGKGSFPDIKAGAWKELVAPYDLSKLLKTETILEIAEGSAPNKDDVAQTIFYIGARPGKTDKVDLGTFGTVGDFDVSAKLTGQKQGYEWKIGAAPGNWTVLTDATPVLEVPLGLTAKELWVRSAVKGLADGTTVVTAAEATKEAAVAPGGPTSKVKLPAVTKPPVAKIDYVKSNIKLSDKFEIQKTDGTWATLSKDPYNIVREVKDAAKEFAVGDSITIRTAANGKKPPSPAITLKINDSAMIDLGFLEISEDSFGMDGKKLVAISGLPQVEFLDGTKWKKGVPKLSNELSVGDTQVRVQGNKDYSFFAGEIYTLSVTAGVISLKGSGVSVNFTKVEGPAAGQATLTAALTGVESPTGVTYAWTTTDGTIVSGADEASCVVSAAGAYTVAVNYLVGGVAQTEVTKSVKVVATDLMAGEPGGEVTGDIESFTAVPEINGGKVGEATYADAAEVIAYLAENHGTVTAHIGEDTVQVTVTAWADSTLKPYNPAVAGDYTFTATLDLPEGVNNPSDLTVTAVVKIYDANTTFNTLTGVNVTGATGTGETGDELTAEPVFDDDGDTDPTPSYQWQISDDGNDGWADIDGEENATYTITADDDTKFIRVAVTADSEDGSVTVYSNAVGPCVDSEEQQTTFDVTFVKVTSPSSTFATMPTNLDVDNFDTTASGYTGFTYYKNADKSEEITGATNAITGDITIYVDKEAAITIESAEADGVTETTTSEKITLTFSAAVTLTDANIVFADGEDTDATGFALAESDVVSKDENTTDGTVWVVALKNDGASQEGKVTIQVIDLEGVTLEIQEVSVFIENT